MSIPNKFSEILFDWHQHVDRDMPWKETLDPYSIWISETILQQTRVSQGVSYYQNFIQQFPNVEVLANAEVESVMKAWEGLGYYSRARNLHTAAKDIQNRFDGYFPKKYKDILSLKGIGPYTASAISSFAFNQPYAVVDGNVMRVLSRYFSLTEPIDTSKGIKRLRTLAQELLDSNKPALYNQAIMDFGAIVCKPKSPSCTECYFSASCEALRNGLTKELPYKSKTIKIRERYLHYFIFLEGDKIYIRQRLEKDIWSKLFEFPMIETYRPMDLKGLKDTVGLSQSHPVKVLDKMKHKLTHQKLNITIYLLNNARHLTMMNDCRLEKVKELSTFAFPKPLKLVIESSIFKNI